MRRSASNSTTRLRIRYGNPNSFIRTVKVCPVAVSRSGPAITEPTEPDAVDAGVLARVGEDGEHDGRRRLRP